ncbi:MAG: GAF domain-containing protein, partial [Rhodospirillaceae bacterium]
MLHRRLSLRVSMVILVSAAVVAACVAITALTFRTGIATARKSATAAFSDVVNQTHDQIDALMSGTLTVAELGATLDGIGRVPARDALMHPGFSTMMRMLRVDTSLYSVFVGRTDGAFFQLIALRGDPRIGERLRVPAGAAFVGRTITVEAGGERRQDWVYLDAGGKPIARRSDHEVDYDPRERPWFSEALAATGAVLSQAYVFNSSVTLGMTASRMVEGGGAVFGVDVTLEGLARYISGLTVSPNARIYAFDDGMSLLAASAAAERHDGADAGRAALSGMLADGRVGTPVLLPDGGERRIAALATWTGPEGRRIHIGVIAPLADFTADFDALIRRVLAIGALVIFAAAPLIYLLSRSMARTVSGLAEDAGLVRNFDFSGNAPLRSFITEFDVLTEAFALMKESLQLRGRDLADVQAKLERLISLGVSMAAERDSSRLMETILVGAKEIANADGGTLYLRTEEDTLRFEIMHNDQLRIRLGGPGGAPPDMPAVPLYTDAGEANHHNVVSHAVHLERTVAIADAYAAPGYDFSGTRTFDAHTGYRSQSFLTVPLKPRGGAVIGAVQLINARHPVGGQVIPFSPEVQSFVEALAAQAATALYNRTLLDSQNQMMDGMIRLVAGAIDAKSPYTGSHCARVPELALMLAEAASTAEQGPFADFAFSTPEQWREFRTGAWLHDCGKVTTPEYVIDKEIG